MTDDLKREWKAIVDFHAEKLAIAKEKLRDLEECKVTKLQFRENVLNLAKKRSVAFKKGWKEIIERGMVENVCAILHECYDSFFEAAENATAFKQKVGEEDSVRFQQFMFKVIEHLFSQNSFGSDKDEDGFQDFEDTAGGCDEIAWNAGLAVLKSLGVDLKTA